MKWLTSLLLPDVIGRANDEKQKHDHEEPDGHPEQVVHDVVGAAIRDPAIVDQMAPAAVDKQPGTA